MAENPHFGTARTGHNAANGIGDRSLESGQKSATPLKFYSKKSNKTETKGDRFITVLDQPLEIYPTPPKKKLKFTTCPATPLSSSALELKHLNQMLNTPTKSDIFPLSLMDLNISKKVRRSVATTPYLVLDAPGARDDYYSDVLDWSSKGELIVGLDGVLYTWVKGSHVEMIYECSGLDYISSCKFSKDGSKFGATTNSGDIFIFQSGTHLVSYKRHQDGGITNFCWTSPHCFTVGDPLGHLTSYDTRSPTTVIYDAHRDRIVGSALSNDGIQLATGCNGHIVNLWDLRKRTAPLHVIDKHESAVRAIDFSPHHSSLLATGGGRQDGNVLFHNTQSGQLTGSFSVGSQITFCKFSRHYNEMLVGSSSSTDQISIWDISSFSNPWKMTSYVGHHYRPLYCATSPDGENVCTMSGDELVKFWKLFPTPKKKKNEDDGLMRIR